MLLYYAIAAVHVIVCVILVLVVLLQSGKGADLSGAFGGAATQTAFGSRGPASFLSRMTTVAAIIFMLTSVGLSLMSSKREAKSILETTKQPSAPTEKKGPATQTPVATPTPEQIQKKVEELQEARKAADSTGAGSGPQEKQPDSNPVESPKPAK